LSHLGPRAQRDFDGLTDPMSTPGLPVEPMAAREAPLVSIVIPCYNQGDFIAQAIDSALSQTYRPIEVIVVDDGSTDSTGANACRYPAVCYLVQPNQGVSAARNRGLEASHGEFLVFLDADDRLLPHAVENGMAELGRRPDAAFAAGQFVLLENDERDPLFQSRYVTSEHYRQLLISNFIWCTAAVLYRRRPLVDMGGFHPSPPVSEDRDLYLRIARRHRIVCHRSIVAEYRRHFRGRSRNSSFALLTLEAIRRQRWFVLIRPTLWRAYRAGKRNCLQQNRENILAEARAGRCSGDRARFLRGLRLVARFFPGSVFSLIRHVHRSNSLDFVVGPSNERSRVIAPPHRGSLVLRELHPPFTDRGSAFNRQPDGSSALAVSCGGARPGATIFFHGRALETTYGNPSFLSAAVPPELYEREGRMEVFIRSY
jgi:glycosyltransferase involved in cell wall biosynthesis